MVHILQIVKVFTKPQKYSQMTQHNTHELKSWQKNNNNARQQADCFTRQMSHFVTDFQVYTVL